MGMYNCLAPATKVLSYQEKKEEEEHVRKHLQSGNTKVIQLSGSQIPLFFNAVDKKSGTHLKHVIQK